ncbi:MAG: serine hydroxymethyltransferase [Myxococcota bacterium]|jgi:glycine hydroxymethyltransferase|nr:serine hydroxymethyltransferase [Myxococcota bacterium]
MSDPSLQITDPEVHSLVEAEIRRQADSIRLIPSENYVSRAVLEASGSVFTNKYSEGYAGKRYYEGQVHVDALERLAIARAKSLFGADEANVQPYSGSPANLAAYTALLQPGETFLGLALPHGGHLTHGWNVSATGRFWRSVQYRLDPTTGLLDMDRVRDLARQERPKLIVAGATAYPRRIDFAAFAAIAQEVEAKLMVDMAHIAGLVAGGAHPSPVPHADVVTTTTHKTLRGPRGGMILCRKEVAKEINKAVFPGLQGGPHNHTTAGIAVALQEAATPQFARYAHQIVSNAKALAEGLLERGFTLVTGGTDNHLILVDLTSKGVPGKPVAQALDRAGIESNYNTIPDDPRKPFDPSGLRLGTPAVTSRGMREPEMKQIASWIDEVVGHLDDLPRQERIRQEVAALCASFPAPGL